MKASTLRAIRAKLGVSQVKFGRMIGRGQLSMCEMEQSKRAIPLSVALAVLAVDAGLSDTEPGDVIERVLSGDSS